MRPACAVLLALALRSAAAPPAASIARKILVPASMRSAPFDEDRYLTVPPGFAVTVLARLPNARFLAVAPNGDVFVSQPDRGTISLIRPGGSVSVWARGLRLPHGLAFDTVDGVTWLYAAETHRVIRYAWDAGNAAAPAPEVVVAELPADGGHPLKNIAIAPDHSLYVAIGSSCNVCVEDTVSDPKRAAVYRFASGSRKGELVARGLRNAEGIALLPGGDSLWAVVNNRDEVLSPQSGQLVRQYVDDHPPEYFTRVRPGGNYGWPFCNANPDGGVDNMPFDTDLEMNADHKADCGTMDRVVKGMQAHSAPLGLAFVNGTRFAAPWQPGAVVAFHGSWDRSEPTGYKVVYFPMNRDTPGKQADLATGFFGWGRPAGLAVAADGAFLITDDLAGAVYRMTWEPSAVSSASGYPAIAPGSYASVYRAVASGIATINLTDSAGNAFAIAPSFLSESQINFIVPAQAATGTGHLTAQGDSQNIDLGEPEIRRLAPGLFQAAAEGDVINLVATGISGADAAELSVLVNGVSTPVLRAGPYPSVPGIDVVQAVLPGNSGTAPLVVELAAGGETSNAVPLTVSGAKSSARTGTTQTRRPGDRQQR